MPKYIVSLFALFFLCNCGGPLSLVSYSIAGGVAMNANQEAFEESERNKYTNKCFPTHRKENPVINGRKLEEGGNLIRAYEYYTLASQLGYQETDKELSRIQPKMSKEELKKAKNNLTKYTEIHLKSCFIPAYY